MNQPLMPMFSANSIPCAYRRAGNRIILGARSGNLPAKETLERRASTLSSQLTPFGVALAAFPKYITDRVDWDSGAAVLTDQYAPANLLNRP